MTYDEFKWTFLDCVRQRAGGEATVRLHKVPKNNGSYPEGISLIESEKGFSPVIYIEPYYEKYQKGASVERLSDHLIKTSREAMKTVTVPFSEKPSLPLIKRQIYVKVINTQLNLDFIESIPHFNVLDLSLVFYYQLEIGSGRAASVFISNRDIKKWKLSPEDLLKLSMCNTVRDKDYSFKRITEVIGEMIGEECFDSRNPIFVLTNKDKLFGAAAVFYPELMKRLSAKLKDDLYILPSSVHEVIVLPAGFSPEENILREMVKSVNQKEVAADEVLSDHIYRFCRESGELVIR